MTDGQKSCLEGQENENVTKFIYFDIKNKKKTATSVKMCGIWDLSVNHIFNIMVSMDNKITKIALIWWIWGWHKMLQRVKCITKESLESIWKGCWERNKSIKGIVRVLDL